MEITVKLAFVLLFMHFLFGVGDRLYEKYKWFGPLVHFVGGLFLGSLTHSLFWGVYLAVLWEVFEAGFDLHFPKHSDYICWHSRSFRGAMHDIFWSAVGIIVILWLM